MLCILLVIVCDRCVLNHAVRFAKPYYPSAMIRMVQSISASQAKRYFSNELAKADYYLDDQELQGRFNGRLAKRIGILGNADKAIFFALCEHINPVTGLPLTQRNIANRTTGYDINFHCPKSVSLLHVLAKDNHILTAFEASVMETMQDIEADSMTRVRKKGAHEDRQTGELLWANFTHQTARPVDGSPPDPHLHSHCYVFNATWDEAEQQFKAGQFRNIKTDMPYYEAKFHKRLSDKLIGLGYHIRKTETCFEIEGVPKGIIDLFSKRSDAIGRFAREHHITDAKGLDALGALTRGKKQKAYGMAELKKLWLAEMRRFDGYEHGDMDTPIRYGGKGRLSQLNADTCIDHILHHAFERASVMGERRLLAQAFRHGIGSPAIDVKAIADNFASRNDIIRVQENNRAFCTTKPVLEEEQRMVAMARQGQGKFSPLYPVLPQISLDGQQGKALVHVLTSIHQVSIIRGAAGAGKTTLMREAVSLIEKAGKAVTVVAPTVEASRDVLVREGFANAQTVAKLLLDENMQEALQGQILLVDEAGLLGTKDMAALLSLVAAKNARVILVGDTRQHASVGRGDALRVLSTVGGVRTAEVSKIYRQRNPHYLEAVEELAKGNVEAGFTKLDVMGAIRDIDQMNPNDALVTDYIAAIRKRKTALIIAPTHSQGNAVTNEVRKRLRALKRLGKKEISVLKLCNSGMTEAQKTDWRNYKTGQVVQFNQNTPKITRGSVWQVHDASEGTVQLVNSKMEQRTLPLDVAAAFEVYSQQSIGLSKGDKIRITRNSFDTHKKRLNNGQSLEVLAVKKSGTIKLWNPISKATYALHESFGHIDHAYCTTSHAAQGKTVDEVFISQPVATFNATDAKQFYVSVSRGRDAAWVYTDDKAALLEHASNAGNRQSAMELVGNRFDAKGYIQQENISLQKENTKGFKL